MISLTLQPSLQLADDSCPAGAFLLTFTVTAATEVDPAIFLYLAHPQLPGDSQPQASFQKICLPVDLQQYPPDQPYPDAEPPRFRTSTLTLAFRGRQEAVECQQLLMVQVQQLLDALDVMADQVAGSPITLTAQAPQPSWVTIG